MLLAFFEVQMLCILLLCRDAFLVSIILYDLLVGVL